MATSKAQRKWRDKNRFVKRQLNIMARKIVHDQLDDVALSFSLRGKAEAVAFSCFIVQALIQRAEYNTEAARMLDLFTSSYHRDKDAYAP
jgi:hypothetical protein